MASAVNVVSASTANFSVSGSDRRVCRVAASQSPQGGTVTVTIEVTAISTGTYTNTLTVLVPATTINLGATQSAVAGTVVNVVNITPSKLVGSVTVAQGLTTSFTLVVSNAGPGTLTGSLNDSIPANFPAPRWRGVASAVNGSASTANFSVSGSGAVCRQRHNRLGRHGDRDHRGDGDQHRDLHQHPRTVLVPATTINLGATESAVAGTVVNVVNITPSKLVGGVTVATPGACSPKRPSNFTLVVSASTGASNRQLRTGHADRAARGDRHRGDGEHQDLHQPRTSRRTQSAVASGTT